MKPSPKFSLPNFLSCFRLSLGFVIPALLLWPSGQATIVRAWNFWTAFGLFLFGTFTDFWDGWLARRHQLETPFGRILDPMADKFFILGAMVSFSMKGIYSYWYLVPIFMREIAVTFCRTVWLYQGHAIGAERAGKLKLGLQVTSVLFSFLYLAAPTSTNLYLNHFFLILALLTTLYSGFFFLRHNQKLLNDKNFARTVAAVGVGFLPPCPGTYGTLLGLLILPAIAHDPLLHLVVFLTFMLVAYVMIPRIGLAKEEDPLEIVIDEVCGILIAFWFVPLQWETLAIGFFVFRFFDVTKIFPIQRLENLKGVNGIMLDDIGAGVYTWLILKLLFK